MISAKDALDYHAGDRPGKVSLQPTKPLGTPRDQRLAYLPGSTEPAREISADPQAAWRYTARSNLVAVISDGSAVPGVGAVGPLAAKPMAEGTAVLLKHLADIDVFDLELDASTPEALVQVIKALEPGFGAIDLVGMRAPQGIAVYEALRDSMSIPVFHETLYGTAMVAVAALINALDLCGKEPEAARVVLCGAGSVGLGCARLLGTLGLPAHQLLVYDEHGLLSPDRGDLSPVQQELARTGPPTLAQGVAGADVLIGASTGGVFTQEMIRSMGRFPVVLALATPEPEITWEQARAARRDVLVGTSQAQDPNAIQDLLAVPYVLRGALDVRATRITAGMRLAAARALADLAREEVVEEVSRAYGDATFVFGPEYLLPKPVDPRILPQVASAVARQAVKEGVARVSVEKAEYKESLVVRMGTGREVLRRLVMAARQVAPRVALPDGTCERTLRAAATLLDEGIAHPILLGDAEHVRAEAHRLGLELGGATVLDPAESPAMAEYAVHLYRRRQRRGLTVEAAHRHLERPLTWALMMLHRGHADMVVGGARDPYAHSLRPALQLVGTAEGVKRVSSMHLVLRGKQVLALADCAVQVEPSAADLAETALLSARALRSLGVEPRVAMLSFSNYGSSNHPRARLVREATEIVRQRAPSLPVDGELVPATALSASRRDRHFPFSELAEDANVLVFPSLEAGHLALDLLTRLSDVVAVGPLLLGTAKPVHVLPFAASSEDVVNLVSLAAAVQGAEPR